MRWSWAEYWATPQPVVDEVAAWMIEESERIGRARREAEEASARARARR